MNGVLLLRSGNIPMNLTQVMKMILPACRMIITGSKPPEVQILFGEGFYKVDRPKKLQTSHNNVADLLVSLNFNYLTSGFQNFTAHEKTLPRFHYGFFIYCCLYCLF